MTIVTKNRFALAVFLSGTLAACSGAGDFAGGGKSDSKKSEGSEGSEGDEADEPQQVAGAFLVDCTFINDDTLFGCTARDKATKAAYSKDDYTTDLVLLNDADEEVAMKTQQAPDSSDFHVFGSLPEAFKDSGKIKMILKSKDLKGTAQSSKIRTAEIKTQGQELGTSIVDGFEEGGVAPTESLKLSSFQIEASWSDKLAVSFSVADPSDFCNGGVIGTSLSPKAQMISQATTELFNGLFDTGSGKSASNISVNQAIRPIAPAQTVGAQTKICFSSFARSLGGSREMAFVGNGCFLVRGTVVTASGSPSEAILVGHHADGADSAVFEKDLRDFLKAKNSAQGCR